MTKVRDAMKASATFNIVGDQSGSKKLALFPGVYSCLKSGVGTGKVITFDDPSNLVNAGYQCDQVADDFFEGCGSAIQVTGTARTKYRDLLNTVQRLGIHVYKIVIQNKATGNGAADLFDQAFEIAATAIGELAGMKFLKLQDFVSVNAYDRSKIELDLSEEPLYIGPQTYVALNIPAGANFSIQFSFEA